MCNDGVGGVGVEWGWGVGAEPETISFFKGMTGGMSLHHVFHTCTRTGALKDCIEIITIEYIHVFFFRFWSQMFITSPPPPSRPGFDQIWAPSLPKFENDIPQ